MTKLKMPLMSKDLQTSDESTSIETNSVREIVGVYSHEHLWSSAKSKNNTESIVVMADR